MLLGWAEYYFSAYYTKLTRRQVVFCSMRAIANKALFCHSILYHNSADEDMNKTFIPLKNVLPLPKANYGTISSRESGSDCNEASLYCVIPMVLHSMKYLTSARIPNKAISISPCYWELLYESFWIQQGWKGRCTHTSGLYVLIDSLFIHAQRPAIQLSPPQPISVLLRVSWGFVCAQHKNVHSNQRKCLQICLCDATSCSVFRVNQQ